MTDVPSLDQRRLNSFEERLRQVQADMKYMHQRFDAVDRSLKIIDHRFDAMDKRFDMLEFRMETMIEEMRRFFARYEHVTDGT